MFFFIPYRPVGALQTPEFLNNFFPLFPHLSVNVQNDSLGRQLLVLVPQISTSRVARLMAVCLTCVIKQQTVSLSVRLTVWKLAMMPRNFGCRMR